MKSRKELKEEFKQKKYRIGVFKISNNINGKIFIGSSMDLDAIWHAQKLQLDFGIHQNIELQKDWKQFGAENFHYEIVEEIIQKNDPKVNYQMEVKILEEMILDDLKPFDKKGYNILKRK